MADERARKAERIVTAPAGITLLPDELGRAQATLGQGAAGTLGDHPLPVFKVFHKVVNIPTGEEQASFGQNHNPFRGKRPDLKPVPDAINVPHGQEQVTVGR